MKITLHQLMEGYCFMLTQVQSSFLSLQRIAYLELMQDAFVRMALNEHHFLGIEELVFRIYLRPKKYFWLKYWIARWRKKNLPIVYELVNPSHPEAIECQVIFRREDKKYSIDIKADNIKNKEHIYVDIT